MQFRFILTSFSLFLALCAQAGNHVTRPQAAVSTPVTASDSVITDMAEAYKKDDSRRLAALLPHAQGHPLEPWAAYWELSARLDTAQPDEVDAFFTRYAGTYQEDRLRNEWLKVLGHRRDWPHFEAAYAGYRMRDDTETRCYALYAAYAQRGENVAAQAEELWLSQRDTDEGCTATVGALLQDKKLEPIVVWRRARLGFEYDKPRIAQQAVALLNPDWANGLDKLYATPQRYLDDKLTALRLKTREWVTLALVRLASTDPDAAATELGRLRWRTQLTAEERSWVWGVAGKKSARSLSDKALGYYLQGEARYMHPDQLAWRVRAALRANDWKQVNDSIALLTEQQLRDPTWIYWRARALQVLQVPNAEVRARALWQSIASTQGFYEQLALEELGQRISVPPPPPPPTAEEMKAARDNPGLQRALAALQLGLRTEGVREWNYTTFLFRPDGMNDRELLAAAALACSQQVWDRCINASERTRSMMDYAQRFPMPYQQDVTQHAQAIGLDPAFVYGLIRQESRFVMNARSNVGAAGLMQVMPNTARWTARRIGLTSFKPHQLNEREVNIIIGTGYLKLVLDSFNGSMPLATAAYNAGPSRSRSWRGALGAPVLEAAVWAENIPFNETRDYVKKVMANTVNYAALLTGQPQSLKARLGFIAPPRIDRPEPDEDLP